MSPDELVVSDVTKRYADGDRTVEAVSGVSLGVRAGELVLLVGPSGSGKTTLLGMLGGLVTPTSGDVRVEGRSLVSMRDHHRTEYRRTHVGFVFQELALVPEMTLLENVLLPLVPRGVTQADRERAQALLERFGLGAQAGPAPAASREASASEARSRARSCTSRGSSCSTSRPPTSTPRTPPACSSSSCASPRRARPSWPRPTTRASPRIHG